MLYTLRLLGPVECIVFICVALFFIDITSGLLSAEEPMLTRYFAFTPASLLPGCETCELPYPLSAVTVVTSVFLHSTHYPLHLFFNMLCLWPLGTVFLAFVGKREFLKTFLLGGIIGNLCFAAFAYSLSSDPAYVRAVGASAGIFAIGGALAVLRPHMRFFIFPFPFPVPLWMAILLAFALVSVSPVVCWEGHLGGLVTGLILGLLNRRRAARIEHRRYDYYW